MKVLVLGRFQVLHNGHAELFRQALELGDELIVGIGSSNESRTSRNPFTAAERQIMISALLDKLGIKYSLFDIPDINDPPNYPAHVLNIINDMSPEETIVFSGNPYTYECFQQKGYKIVKQNQVSPICATVVRQKIADGEAWERYVSETTVNAMKKINGIEIVRRCCGGK